MSHELISRPQVNLKLWVLVVVYAAGIVGGTELFSFSSSTSTSLESHSSSLLTLGLVLIVIALIISFFWALKRSNPSTVGAYCLLIFLFCIAGVVAGYTNGAADNARTTTANNKSETSISEAAGKPQQVGYDVEKIPIIKTVRQHIDKTFKKSLNEQYRGLMMGVTLGETGQIPPDMTSDFKTTGLSHILAVSGLNITILILAFGYVVRAITVNLRSSGRYIAFAVTVTAIIFYMFLTKLQPSVVRAGIMGIAALATILASRPGNSFPALAAAALMILIVDPAALFDIGFQLSFAATITILTFTPQLEKAFKAAPRGIAAAAALTMSAQLGVAPLLVMYFGHLSIIAVAANIVVSPVVVVTTILGIIISVAGVISTILAQATAYPATLCLAYIANTARYFAGWPYASLTLPSVSTFHIVVYYGVLAILYVELVRLNKKPELRATINDFPNRRWARAATAIITIAVLVVGLFGCQAAKTKPPTGLRVVFIDVGQGDAALIETEDGATVLIDGGPEPDSAITALREHGIRSIDLMIVTHPHSDHINGLPSIASRYYIKQAVLPDTKSGKGLYGQLVLTLGREGVGKAIAREGQTYEVGKHIKVNILSPDEAILGATGADESDDANNRATVVLVRYKKVKMMFTGDIEIPTEEAMVADGEAEDVDILKVPHHGSKNGASEKFINAIRPEVAVISVGQNNPFHHPAPSTVSLLKRAGAAVYRTDKNGSVIIESDGSNIYVSTSKQ